MRAKSGRDGAVEVQKLLDEGIGREIADLVWSADLLDGAFVDDDDAVGDFESFLLVMGDEEAGQARGIVKAAQPMAQFLAHLGIERPEGFVEEENFRLDSQGTSESHALALSAGELAGKAFSELRELDGLQELLDAGADLGLWRSLASLSHAQAEGDVLKDAEMLKERVVLEDKSRAALVRALPRDVPIAEEDLSLLRNSSPAMIRRRVVLPDPLGPSRATSSPPSTVKSTLFSAGYSPKLFVMFRIWMLMLSSSCGSGPELALGLPFSIGLDD